MNIDWSKAPEGATHFSDGNPRNGKYPAWWRPISKRDDLFECWAVGTSFGCEIWQPGPFHLPENAVKREWTGEGLPPVGVVCEWSGCTFAPEDPKEPDLHIGDQVTIIAHFKDGEFDLAAFTFNPQIHNHGRGTAWVGQGAHGCFRPIRTP